MQNEQREDMLDDPTVLGSLLEAMPSAWFRAQLLSILLTRETARAIEQGGVAGIGTAYMSWLEGKLSGALAEYWQGIVNS